MDTSLLSVQDRAQLEELLDQFDRALKECRGGRLPDVDSFLGDSQGHARDYLRREMESLWQDLVRGEYIKLRRIGGGGMGEVFLARHVKLGRQFALKEIKLECLQHSDRAEFEKRFKREVEACGRLEHHPNLVSVTNTGTSDSGVPYLVMEFVDGQDLKQIVERVGPLEIADACRIIHDAAVGLSHAHEMGLIHRDIKPSNIMVSKHGVVTVLDLGLARIIEGDRQATYVSTPGLVGSFDYMSPEQCREEFVIDARADVYSLGCTLYFLLVGRPPFAEEKSIFQKLNAHQQHPLPPIERLREYEGLWQIVERMTAKEPADRFTDLASVMMALRPYLGGASLASLVAADYQSLTRTRDDSGSTMRYTPGGGSRKGSGSKTVVGDTATSGTRRFSRRMFLTAAGATAAAGVAGGLTYLYTRPKPFTGPIALFLGTMPGLNGRWWFEETPWLLPELRMYLARSLAETPGALEELSAVASSADVVALHAQLRRYIDAARGQWPRDVTDRLSKLQNLDPETLGDDGLEEALSRMVESLETRRLTSGLSAVQWHELAILQHQRNEGESAVLAYEEAAQRYDAEGNRPLLALCLADWGQLRMRERRFVLAQEKFNSAREAVAKIAGDDTSWTTWFMLDSLCNEGDAHRGFGNWEPALACLRQAAALAADASIDSEHPLRAVFHERCGWYHLDVWRPTAARDDFSRAKTIREANDRQGNPFALHFSYWNRQGNAMVDFLGYDHIEQARDALTAMLTPPASGLRRKQYDQLKSRFPNLHERLADTGLVRADLKVDPVDELRKAIVAGESEGFREDGRWAHLVRLLFKSAVVTAFTSGRETANKQLEAGRGELAQFQKSQTIQAVRTASGKRPQVYATSHELAAACVDWLDADAAAKERGRRALLAQLGRSTIEIARDDMLLLLYVGEQLVKSKSLSNEDRQTVSQKMIALTQIEPKAAAVDPKNTTDAAAPALFLEYRRRAEAKS